MRHPADHAALDYSEAVHRLARMVPPGAVLSYKDVAELLGSGGARQAGRAMTSAPEGTPWWRIVRSDGGMAPALQEEARPRWESEGLAAAGRKIAVNRRRWQPGAAQWEQIDALRQGLGNPKMSEADDLL